MKENEYECAICHGIFAKSRSDEEALEETKNVFGKDYSQENIDNGDLAVICDDCWKKGLPNYIKGDIK